MDTVAKTLGMFRLFRHWAWEAKLNAVNNPLRRAFDRQQIEREAAAEGEMLLYLQTQARARAQLRERLAMRHRQEV